MVLLDIIFASPIARTNPFLLALAPFAGWIPYKRELSVLVASRTLSEANSTCVATTAEEQAPICGAPSRSVADILSDQIARIGKTVPNLLVHKHSVNNWPDTGRALSPLRQQRRRRPCQATTTAPMSGPLTLRPNLVNGPVSRASMSPVPTPERSDSTPSLLLDVQGGRKTRQVPR